MASRLQEQQDGDETIGPHELIIANKPART